ncbi:MAG TPA: dienelactone hydrolase family protein [Candidatus Cybelea sp.]|nr:dienelactone hydrolase family protein [Candidatus Cybelea sp.]
MAGKYITIAASGGAKFRGYLATPKKGTGPGIVLLQEIFGVNQHMRDVADLYAEEGYTVLCPDLFWRLEPGIELGQSEDEWKRAFELYQKFDVAKSITDMRASVKALKKQPKCKGKVAALGFCLGGKLAYLAAAHAGVDLAISYYGVGIDQDLKLAKKIKCPMVMHFAELDQYAPPAAVAKIRKAFAKRPDVEIYNYPGADHGFNRVTGMHYDKPASMMAHTRSIAALRRVAGPHYDLSALWDAHTMYEFGTRDVDATMATMVPEPYVNHIPTMTGGVGHKNLKRFYKYHFIPKTPKDTKLVPISRTVGADRIVDEMLFCFTHDIEIDWMLPGVAPGRASGHKNVLQYSGRNLLLHGEWTL